jgi:hypothetical protein
MAGEIILLSEHHPHVTSRRMWNKQQGSQNVPATGDFAGYFWLSAIYKFVKTKDRSW